MPANASGGVDTGSSDGLFHFSWVAPELDAACRESTDQAGLTCAREVNAANQRCWRTRLTPMCQAQMTSPSAPRDPACTVQSMRVCTALSDYPHCIQRELPGGCMAQVRKANRERERKTSHCARDDQGEAAAIKACHGGGRIPWEVDTCVAKVRRAACH